ncbi:hypothetical protein SAMN04487948_105121 [Halogranum amylolyticum]|uniref:Uncharacterized protein n=1 Tax=Halogranum amylolyticum TaxID=660520 RepID=A0A1H8SIS2_9EURY|nr:hypothetical protein SAMN04487948_105121 [Halogranum amylolyticum]
MCSPHDLRPAIRSRSRRIGGCTGVRPLSHGTGTDQTGIRARTPKHGSPRTARPRISRESGDTRDVSTDSGLLLGHPQNHAREHVDAERVLVDVERARVVATRVVGTRRRRRPPRPPRNPSSRFHRQARRARSAFRWTKKPLVHFAGSLERCYLTSARGSHTISVAGGRHSARTRKLSGSRWYASVAIDIRDDRRWRV